MMPIIPILLENVAINDALPLDATRRYAIANAKCFWGPKMPSNSFRWFHLHSLCGATLFGLHQRHLTVPPYVWHSLVLFCLLTSVCNAWQRSRTQNLQKVLENSSPIITRSWTKVHEFLGQCKRPFVLSSALGRLSMSRFIQKIFTIKCRSRRKTKHM